MKILVKNIILSTAILCSLASYAEENKATEAFNKLRDNHKGRIAAKAFSAQMDSKSARKLVQGKIKGNFIVDVFYHTEKGIELSVRETESFYERILSPYAVYVNMMLLPLLSTSGYERLQKRFSVSIPQENMFRVEYKRGDVPVTYLFKVGILGLVDQIAYYEKGVKIFVLEIVWKKIDNYFVPELVKTISYDKTRIAGSFGIENIKLRN